MIEFLNFPHSRKGRASPIPACSFSTIHIFKQLSDNPFDGVVFEQQIRFCCPKMTHNKLSRCQRNINYMLKYSVTFGLCAHSKTNFEQSFRKINSTSHENIAKVLAQDILSCILKVDSKYWNMLILAFDKTSLQCRNVPPSWINFLFLFHLFLILCKNNEIPIRLTIQFVHLLVFLENSFSNISIQLFVSLQSMSNKSKWL